MVDPSAGTVVPARWRIIMNVMDTARAIGLASSTGEVTGTIDQEKVLGALADLEDRDPENAELFRAIAARVRGSRSAGVEQIDATSVFTRPDAMTDVATTQLRYRSEMSDLFTDLAIDVGLRDQDKLVTVD